MRISDYITLIPYKLFLNKKTSPKGGVFYPIKYLPNNIRAALATLKDINATGTQVFIQSFT
jgi:hypothetical protein